jgi:hypothetical protein
MNWTTCSSVRANVDRKMPRLTAPSASSSATRNARAGEPALAMPSPTENAGSGPMTGTWRVPRANAMMRMTWSVAKNPKPAL